MPHPIPEPYCWDKSFEVFYANLDEEHRGLFDAVFECAKDRASSSKLKHLADVVKKHFSTEEAMMTKAKYPDYPGHKKMHDDFVGELGKLSNPLGDDTIHFAKDWLVQHIKDTDFKYKGKL